MIRIHPYAAGDEAGVTPQDAQLRDWPIDLRPHLAAMSAKGRAFTIRADVRVLAIVGLLEVHSGAATGWAVMAQGCWGHMGELTRIVRQYLDDQPYRRIDMLVRAEFAAGHRWARRLGFAREATLRAWSPDGGDMVMFARFREAGRV